MYNQNQAEIFTSGNEGVCSLASIFDEIPDIYKNREALSHRFVPEGLPHREGELKELASYLKHAIKNFTPPNILVLGHTGTGKTVTVKKVLGELSRVVGDKVDIAYLVASGTKFQILNEIAMELNPNVSFKGLGFKEAWNRFRRMLDKDKITIIVLDEIDKMLPSESDLLYFLSREERVCIISISNKINVLDMITDRRVLSSFNPIKMVFPKYNAEQLGDILEYRAKEAFYDGVLDNEVIPLCAAFAMDREGDARYALDLLMYAGDEAIRRMNSKVTVEHVKIARKKLEEDFIRNSIRNLSLTQKLLLFAVMKKEGESPRSIYTLCNEYLERYTGNTLTHRRLSSLLGDLELYGFVTYERRGRGRGKGTRWSLYLNDTLDRNLIISVLKEELAEERRV